MKQRALVPSILENTTSNILVQNISAVFLGVLLLSLLSQIKIYLPWTVVPITGQTFGVTLIGLCWGPRRGFMTLASYLTIGFLGAPVFANASTGLLLGPTSGYLFGMLMSATVTGYLAEKGWVNSYRTCLAAGFVGSVFIFSFGLMGLSFFVKDNLLAVGLLPFLPGDIIKTSLAAGITRYAYKKLQN